MARAQYFTLTSGERVNFDQVRFWIVSGSDIIVQWNSGTAATDLTVFTGGATDAAAIDAFLAASQDTLIENNPLITQHDGTLIIDDVTPTEYNRDIFIRANMNQVVNALFGNQVTLDSFSQAQQRQGQPAGPAIAAKVFDVSVAMADKWELENP